MGPLEWLTATKEAGYDDWLVLGHIPCYLVMKEEDGQRKQITVIKRPPREMKSPKYIAKWVCVLAEAIEETQEHRET